MRLEKPTYLGFNFSCYLVNGLFHNSRKLFFCPNLGSCLPLRPRPTIHTGPHVPAQVTSTATT